MRKSYYCEKLEKTLHFMPDGVKFCCSCAEGAGIKINDFSKFNKQDIISAKNKFTKMLQEGIIPKECKGCLEYKERTFQEKLKLIFKNKIEKKVSHIIIDHYKQCDCSCIYCSQIKLFPDKNQKYELLPVIRELYESNIIDPKNLKAEFQGGNISLLKEFEPLMREFSSHNCDDFVILMNAIKYIPLLEKIGNNPKSHICISIDAGTKETFKKIKNVDAFDRVIENIKKLRKNSQAQISLKYIIIKDINDNLEELDKFLNIVKETGNVNPAYLEIDYNNTLLSSGIRFDIPEHYYEMFDYAEKFCKRNGINYTLLPYTKSILDKGYSI